jgi:hypothetical protein
VISDVIGAIGESGFVLIASIILIAVLVPIALKYILPKK